MGVLPLEPVGGEGGGWRLERKVEREREFQGRGRWVETGGGVKGVLYNSAYLAFCLLDAVKCQKNDCMSLTQRRTR